MSCKAFVRLEEITTSTAKNWLKVLHITQKDGNMTLIYMKNEMKEESK